MLMKGATTIKLECAVEIPLTVVAHGMPRTTANK
jgi:hypothetical protein